VKGSYILVLQLEAPVASLQIGRLGRFDFAAGFYLYAGSAFGPGGLAARVAHHTRREKARPHWHIDYLRAVARLREAWTVGFPERLEWDWCRAMAAHPALSAPVKGFGASDTPCATHLFYSARRPHPSLLTGIILSAAAEHPGELVLEIHSLDDH
jgi:Uri superfamily endonuclease